MPIFCLYVFNKAYLSTTYDNTLFKQYFSLDTMLVVIFAYFFKSEFMGYNGIDKVVRLWKSDHYVVGSLVAAENLVLLLVVMLKVSSLIEVLRWGNN